MTTDSSTSRSTHCTRCGHLLPWPSVNAFGWCETCEKMVQRYGPDPQTQAPPPVPVYFPPYPCPYPTWPVTIYSLGTFPTFPDTYSAKG